jgi:hypothetical protein
MAATMSSLISDYKSARRAIFEHCAVPEDCRSLDIYILECQWKRLPNGKIDTPRDATEFSQIKPLVDDKWNSDHKIWDPGRELFTGTQLSAFVDDLAGDEWHPEYALVVLYNSLELK